MAEQKGAYVVVRPDHARRLHWSWRCLVDGCGWVGYDLYSEGAAEREAGEHVRRGHCLACGSPAPLRGSWRHECAPRLAAQKAETEARGG